MRTILPDGFSRSTRGRIGTSSTCRLSPRRTKAGARRARLCGRRVFHCRPWKGSKRRSGQVLGRRCTSSVRQQRRARSFVGSGGNISPTLRCQDESYRVGIARSRPGETTTTRSAPRGSRQSGAISCFRCGVDAWSSRSLSASSSCSSKSGILAPSWSKTRPAGNHLSRS